MAANPTKYRYLAIHENLFDGVKIKKVNNLPCKNFIFEIPGNPDVILVRINMSGMYTDPDDPWRYVIADKSLIDPISKHPWHTDDFGYARAANNLGLHQLALWGSIPIITQKLDLGLEPHHQKHLFDNRINSLVEVSKRLNNIAPTPKHTRDKDYYDFPNNTLYISDIKDLLNIL